MILLEVASVLLSEVMRCTFVQDLDKKFVRQYSAYYVQTLILYFNSRPRLSYLMHEPHRLRFHFFCQNLSTHLYIF